MSILIGDGAGGFGPATTPYTTGSNSRRVTVGDFNGDGDQDLVVVHSGNGIGVGSDVTVHLGDGTAGLPRRRIWLRGSRRTR